MLASLEDSFLCVCVCAATQAPCSLDSSDSSLDCHHELLSASAADGSSRSLASGTSAWVEVPACVASATSLRICSSSRKSSFPAPQPRQAPQQAASGSYEWEPVVPDFFGHQAARASVQDYDPGHDDEDDAGSGDLWMGDPVGSGFDVLGGLRGDLEVLGRVWGG